MLVVSPLLALMRDQLGHLPPQLPAAMLWGGQSKEEARFILRSLSVSLPTDKLRLMQQDLSPPSPLSTSCSLSLLRPTASVCFSLETSLPDAPLL